MAKQFETRIPELMTNAQNPNAEDDDLSRLIRVFGVPQSRLGPRFFIPHLSFRLHHFPTTGHPL
jgi:hypothetical protein